MTNSESRTASTAHTPGPWSATPSDPAEGYECWWITGGHRRTFEKELATVAGGATTSEANARLIAAAPELLEAAIKQEAAEKFHLSCDECSGEEIPELCPKCFPHYDDARVMRRNAIAEATGAVGDRESDATPQTVA